MQITSIPLSDLRPDPDNTRRVRASAAANAALHKSISVRGMLQPILVRRGADGTFIITEGHRRVEAAEKLGLTEVAAVVVEGLAAGDATAVQAATNIVREPMHPVDQWRAVVKLQSQGYTLAQASASLGLDERYARRLDKLGRLHEDVLKLIEQYGLPSERDLAAIALAPAEQQRKAVKSNGKPIKQWDSDALTVSWRDIAGACRSTRFSRNKAIFDLDKSKIKWDEDLFAQPGDDDQFTTTDGKAFLAAQADALHAQVKERQARKERVEVAQWSDRNYGIAFPPGFERSYNNGKPKSTEMLFCAVKPDGSIEEQLAVDTKAEKARAAERAKKEAAKAKAQRTAAQPEAGDDGDQHQEDEEAGEDETTPAPIEPKLPFTKAGLAAIAAAKTIALREHLRGEETAQRSHEEMLRLLILLLGCRNISIQSSEVRPHFALRFQDLAERLLLPGGQIDPHTGPTLPGIAGELIARIVGIGEGMTGSGDPAEWIGAAIGADEALPRFDTAEFLAFTNGDELRRAAEAAGIKPPAKVSAMREQLVGKLPDWKPATFGAPAPVVQNGEW